MFLFKIILRAAIPNVPLTIKLAVQRSKYMSRVANEGLDSEMDEDYDDDDMDSLSQSDETDTQSSDDNDDDDDDDETVSRRGSSLWRAQTHLGIGSNTSGGGDEVDSGQADSEGAKKNSHPGLGMVRSWSSRVLQFGGSSSKRKKNKRKHQREINDAGLRGKNGAATLSAAMAGALPKIQETPPSIRSESVAGTNGAGTGPGAERRRRPEDFNELDDGYGDSIMTQQQQEKIQHPSPLAQSPIVGIDRPLHPSQSLSSQRRPPMPQRANTEMDGEWIVLEEKGM